MTNFVYNNVALPSNKIDSAGGSSVVANPTRKWSPNDANRTFSALTDLRIVLGDQVTNAMSFGAIGDGVTDDTAAIQAALDAAEGKNAVVYLPRAASNTGVYIISDTVYIPSKVVLSGVGRADLGLKASATFPTDGRPMVRLGRIADTLVFGCRVEGMSINCNSRAKIGVFSTAANEQSGVRRCVVSNFTQYGIHFNGASGILVEDSEIYPQSAGATTGIFLDTVALDNLVLRTTIGVSGLLGKGLHVSAAQCTAVGLHIENCTAGVFLDTNSAGVLIGVNGPGVNPDVGDLIIDNGVNHHIGIGLVKNNATRLLTSNAGGYIISDAFLPLWVGGNAVIGGATNCPFEVQPSQITANQNDYSPAQFASVQLLILTSDAARDITGFAAQNRGREIDVYNIGAFNITLKHQNAGSTAANRIIGRANGDTVLTPGTSARIHYSGPNGRWLVLGDTL